MDPSTVSRKLLAPSASASVVTLDRRVSANGILYPQIRPCFSLSLAWLSRLLLVGSLALLTACGGGGDEGPNQGFGWLTIEQPTAGPTYTTESDVIRLSGSAFAAPNSVAVVTWAGGQAQSWYDYCVNFFGERVPCGFLHWSADIPLVVGVNVITMKAEHGSSVGYDTITITRLADTKPPTVSSTTPGNGATNVSVDASIQVNFSEAMDAATLSSATFSVADDGGNSVSGTVTGSVSSATFAPAMSLAGLTTYTATISTGIRDAAGNAIAAPFTWSFTTGL
jgi:hypothetical protein